MFKNFLLCYILLLPLIGFAQPKGFVSYPDEADFEKQLLAQTVETQSLQSNFVQHKHLSFLEETITTEGQFWYKNDNLLRWQYTSPFKYSIVLNNGKLLIDDEGRRQEMDLQGNEMFKKINQIIIDCLEGNVLHREEFAVEIFDNETLFLAILQPKMEGMADYISGIHVFFNKKDMQVARVKMLEGEDDYTDIEFKQPKVNGSIDDSIFVLD